MVSSPGKNRFKRYEDQRVGRGGGESHRVGLKDVPGGFEAERQVITLPYTVCVVSCWYCYDIPVNRGAPAVLARRVEAGCSMPYIDRIVGNGCR